MVITYCQICRRVKIDAAEARQMVADFDAAEELEKEDVLREIEELEDEDKVAALTASIELQTRKKITVPEEFKGETWVELSDQEWGAIQTITQSSKLLYLVDNYADYPEICPDCATIEKIQVMARKN